jgi:hypothetical protein
MELTDIEPLESLEILLGLCHLQCLKPYGPCWLYFELASPLSREIILRYTSCPLFLHRTISLNFDTGIILMQGFFIFYFLFKTIYFLNVRVVTNQYLCYNSFFFPFFLVLKFKKFSNVKSIEFPSHHQQSLNTQMLFPFTSTYNLL